MQVTNGVFLDSFSLKNSTDKKETMSDSNDQCSDASSDLNWPLDHSTERQVDDQVVFENVADQYVKGEDVTVFFTILQDIKVNSEEDQVGLLRVRICFLSYFR